MSHDIIRTQWESHAICYKHKCKWNHRIKYLVHMFTLGSVCCKFNMEYVPYSTERPVNSVKKVNIFLLLFFLCRFFVVFSHFCWRCCCHCRLAHISSRIWKINQKRSKTNKKKYQQHTTNEHPNQM